MTPRIATIHDVPAITAELRAAPMVALDTEFHTERTWLPELFLVQMVVPGNDPWILDPLVPGLLPAVAPALLGGSTWLLHAGEHDLRVLAPALGGVADTIYDTQIAAALVDEHHPAGLGRLVETWTGERMGKVATLSDWSRRPLDAEQLAYAADDVVTLPKLWDRLMARADELDRVDIILDACADARERSMSPVDQREFWRDLVSHPGDREEAAILQALAAWREQLAIQENRPARTLISDAALRQLARTRPLDVRRIEAQRRLPRAFVKTYGPQIVDAARQATAKPEEWPIIAAPGTPAARRSNALRIFADVWGHRYHFAGSFVLPVATRDAVAQTAKPDPGRLAALLPGWRQRLIGELLWESLAGKQAIAILDGEPQIAAIRSDGVSAGRPSADPTPPPPPVV